MRKEIWFVQRLGPIEILVALIAVTGIASIGGLWVTTEARQVYAHPMDNIPYTALILLLYLAFNGLLIGFCCAAALYILKFIYFVIQAACRLMRKLMVQPIHLIGLLTSLFTALARRFSR